MDNIIKFSDKEYKFLSESAERFSVGVKEYILLLALSYEVGSTIKCVEGESNG